MLDSRFSVMDGRGFSFVTACFRGAAKRKFFLGIVYR